MKFIHKASGKLFPSEAHLVADPYGKRCLMLNLISSSYKYF